MVKEASPLAIERNVGNFAYPETHTHDAGVRLTEKTIHYISDIKQDPDWVREFRLNAYKTFMSKPMPTHWASKDLDAIVFDNIRYYLSAGTQPKRNWEDVPDDVKRTFERLGIPEQERKFLAGVEAQFDSEAVYSNIKKAVGEQGVIFVGSREGCTAPKFNTATLHSAVVELVALKGAKLQYITVQNWSSNVFNLVTKRGLAHEDAEVKWIDCNIGSRLTMKYPGVIMKGRRARGEVLSIALAGDGQHQDTGAKMVHAADETTSNIISKSISIGEGRATYRGLVQIPKHLKNCKNNTECDALLINSTSRTDTYPAITVRGTGNSVQHEASVSQVSAEQIFYMQQRGLTEAQAMSLSVNGFVNDLVRQFPMEYSVELKRLIELEMEGSVG